MHRHHLAKQIEESPLDNPTRDLLIRRLKVASAEGAAKVQRDFEEEMVKYRARVLPSCRGRGDAQNKRAITLNHA